MKMHHRTTAANKTFYINVAHLVFMFDSGFNSPHIAAQFVFVRTSAVRRAFTMRWI